MAKQKVIIIGAGLSGSLLAIYLAKHGIECDIYEARGDMRKEKIPAGRSINLALSNRGIAALCEVGIDKYMLAEAVPMFGRMIHDLQGNQKLLPYSGRKGEFINSISRAGLNIALMNEAEKYEGIRFHFHQKCVDFDCRTGKVKLESGEIITGDTVFGTDGAGSVIRNAMLHGGVVRFNFSQSWLEHGYKELHIPPSDNGGFQMEKNALHIWARRSFMMIALPNFDGSFTCTLFLAHTNSRSGVSAGGIAHPSRSPSVSAGGIFSASEMGWSEESALTGVRASASEMGWSEESALTGLRASASEMGWSEESAFTGVRASASEMGWSEESALTDVRASADVRASGSEVSFEQLTDKKSLLEFFETNFADALTLMPTLVEDFFANPVGNLGTIKCFPWNVGGKCLLIGDAAHAIVPFYGQGMNASFEDCRILNRLIEKHGTDWATIFEEFALIRKPNTDAIADMAEENFYEMRDAVADPVFQRKRELETLLEQTFPDYFSKYSMVTFREDLPYLVAKQKGNAQDKLLMEICAGVSHVGELDLTKVKERIQALEGKFYQSAS